MQNELVRAVALGHMQFTKVAHDISHDTQCAGAVPFRLAVNSSSFDSPDYDPLPAPERRRVLGPQARRVAL